ncbi:hypothetical protein GCM10010399_40710 [Dactylosporangium fulvum]|uniref:Uncharacterized protein n=1 Tax=Dactylosporangium fulvum TaxID=53359 RepID=A0ABY5W2Y0_9ACTN|nr:hypothetical protein [Dactylosporangium fulvum]UWP84302.1 hypothetical protein Dfulv_08715 [Dactylosporangium fulvum]
MAEPRRDPWRAVRKSVAQVIVLFTVVYLFVFGRAVLGVGRSRDIERSTAAWTVWTAGIALMVAGSALAVQLLRGKEPAVTGRRTIWWCAGLWAVGVALALIYSTMVTPPTR